MRRWSLIVFFAAAAVLMTGCMRFEVNLRVFDGGDGTLELITQFSPAQANERYRELKGADYPGYVPGAESVICEEVFTDTATATAVPGAAVDQVFTDGWCVERFSVAFAASDNPGQVLANAGVPGWDIRRSGDEWQFDASYGGPNSRLATVNTRGLTGDELGQVLSESPLTVQVTLPGSPISDASNSDAVNDQTFTWNRSVVSPQSFSARSSLTGATQAQPTPAPQDDTAADESGDVESTDDSPDETGDSDDSEGDAAADDSAEEGPVDLEEAEFVTGTDSSSDDAADNGSPSDPVVDEADDEDSVVEPEVTTTDESAPEAAGQDPETADSTDTADTTDAATEVDAANEAAAEPTDALPEGANRSRTGPSPWALAALGVGAILFGAGLFYALRRGPDLDPPAPETRTSVPLFPEAQRGFEDVGQPSPSAVSLLQQAGSPGRAAPGFLPTDSSPVGAPMAPGGVATAGAATVGDDPFAAWPESPTPPIASTATPVDDPMAPPTSIPDPRASVDARPIDASTIRWDDQRRLWVSDDPVVGQREMDPETKSWRSR